VHAVLYAGVLACRRACMFACTCVCVQACLQRRVFARRLACEHACLSSNVLACKRAIVLESRCACVVAGLPANVLACFSVGVHAYRCARVFAWRRANVQACRRSCVLVCTRASYKRVSVLDILRSSIDLACSRVCVHLCCLVLAAWRRACVHVWLCAGVPSRTSACVHACFRSSVLACSLASVQSYMSAGDLRVFVVACIRVCVQALERAVVLVSRHTRVLACLSRRPCVKACLRSRMDEFRRSCVRTCLGAGFLA
jgi:hypothetical protein